MDGELVKRRTRLRKLGLPADPKPQASRPPQPSYDDLALALHQELSNIGVYDPSHYTADWNVLEDCRVFGISETVACLQKCGMTPSQFRWRFG